MNAVKLKDNAIIKTIVLMGMLGIYSMVLYETRTTPIYHPLYLFAVIYVWFPWFIVMFFYDHLILARCIGRSTTFLFEILLFILICF